nr:unnamed protein product [Callosobruchus analis]
MKKLWEIVAGKTNATFECNFTFSQVENRWRVLERNYKKMVDINNKNRKRPQVIFVRKRNGRNF